MDQSEFALVLQPLAARMRPRNLAEYVGQSHLLGADKVLYRAIHRGILHSMILWGPPGTGKTTLAHLMAKATHAHFIKLSAIFAGVKEIRAAVATAQQKRKERNQATILFIDEIHRFNKAQQDAFLPFVENGTLTLIGATTENPSFELNNPLLSRARVYLLKRLTESDLLCLLAKALDDKERGLGSLDIIFPGELRPILVSAVDGDARQLLNLLEVLAEMIEANGASREVTVELLAEVVQQSPRRFDKQGEYFYDQISALHKSVRGSAPDAALYWLARILDGGCDPLYVARRMIRIASEDIGNADPRALSVALDACSVYERLGSPEGELALAQAVVYLAIVPKSNAVYVAFQQAMVDAKQYGTLEVPLHIRNAPTRLMQQLGYGKAYRYAHDEPEAYAAGENYFPDELQNKIYYQPSNRGLETKLAERLAYLRGLDKKYRK